MNNKCTHGKASYTLEKRKEIGELRTEWVRGGQFYILEMKEEKVVGFAEIGWGVRIS